MRAVAQLKLIEKVNTRNPVETREKWIKYENIDLVAQCE